MDILKSKLRMDMQVTSLQIMLREERLLGSGDRQHLVQYDHKILREQIKILRCPRFAIP